MDRVDDMDHIGCMYLCTYSPHGGFSLREVSLLTVKKKIKVIISYKIPRRKKLFLRGKENKKGTRKRVG